MMRTPLKTKTMENYEMIFMGEKRVFKTVILTKSPFEDSWGISGAEINRLKKLVYEENMKITDTMVLFWGGPFSQWYKHKMLINGVIYNTAEQYMMAMKAKHFGDTEAQEKIMRTSDPAKQKAIGRTVKNFNPAVWSAVSRTYVRKANHVKFEDPELRKVLLDTGKREIVEASPYDKIWGIGLGEDDPRALNKNLWQGTNWLGEVLMDVRDWIVNGDKNELP